MKTLNIILSLIIVLISCMPCADMEVNSSAHKAAELIADHTDHSHDKQNDTCSPFCICNCCGVQVLSYAASVTFDFPVAVAIIKRPLPSYSSVFASSFFGSIWQPPQIA